MPDMRCAVGRQEQLELAWPSALQGTRALVNTIKGNLMKQRLFLAF